MAFNIQDHQVWRIKQLIGRSTVQRWWVSHHHRNFEVSFIHQFRCFVFHVCFDYFLTFRLITISAQCSATSSFRQSDLVPCASCCEWHSLFHESPFEHHAVSRLHRDARFGRRSGCCFRRIVSIELNHHLVYIINSHVCFAGSPRFSYLGFWLICKQPTDAANTSIHCPMSRSRT